MNKDSILKMINNRSVILFGASQSAVDFLDSYPLLRIQCFWDNDKNKWGTVFLGKEVHSPRNEVGKPKPFIVITSMYSKEIALQLNSMGFTENEDFISSEQLNEIIGKVQFFQPGHFYSPVPDILDIKNNENKFFGKVNSSIPGVNLNIEHQFHMLNILKEYIIQFKNDYALGNFKRFFLNNNYFEKSDASVLYSMILTEKPKKIIEVGSGFSSALMLDIKNLYHLSDLKLTFIEPYPQRLESLLDNKDYEDVTIYRSNVQMLDLDIFLELEKGDILFIDSSHVSKIGSDVNFLLFEVLPKLRPGVRVHFHDIFYPFEYPKEWVTKGVFWNEAYLLRAFLQYNPQFIINFWEHYLTTMHRDTVNKIAGEGILQCGGSIWIRKI